MEMIWISGIILLNVDSDKYINLKSDVVFLGKEKLKKIKAEGVKRKLMG